ncbi:hypothetical protein MHZ95_18015 [Sporosarcina sp. ACRSM]|uniref:hypothetical protein n=1 Tax=Sporosarcina sp. ACRSM TaxID=2918216 RepID=UPI001EF47B54|nr:hypothetical protein [Sporosarcina sp. ACRSM]MCG7337158.1 hypothetical protein [Sporosarcina sp. ACRSM]
MKKLIGFLMLAMVLVLAACGDDSVETTDKEVGSVTGEQKETNKEEVQDENEKNELNQEVADTENIKATLVSIEKIVDKEWDEEKYKVTFEVENKREDTITVQAREVSADGKMIDESMLMMSQDISGGKKADAVLEIQNYDGDLPEINENLELILYVFSNEDFETVEEHKVVTNLK